MSGLREAEKRLSKLSRAEKALLLQWVVRPCIVRTRIPVWVLGQARRLGTTEAELLRSYPNLRAVDLANAWACVRAHRDEIDREIETNEAA
jgi:uncharacterized protein (DUF433 family)